jgi:hypothetical protein
MAFVENFIMRGPLHSRLRPVRLRQRGLCVLESAAMGWLVGSATAVGLALARLAWLDLPLGAVLGVSAAGLALGAVVGLLRRRSWSQAAQSVDTRYRLKDRIASALDFSEHPKDDKLRALTVSDAVEHLAAVKPREVVPLAVPRAAAYALAVLVLAVALVLVPRARDAAQASLSDPIDSIVAQAEQLEETMIPELEQLAKEHQDQKLKELAEEIKKLVEEMKQPGVDVRQALAQLSEMQAAVAEAQAQFNLEAVDASLKQLGQAISPAAALMGAASALQEGKYSEAAEQLEQLDASKLSRKEARTVSNELKKVAKQMADGQQGQLSEATNELAEGLESENPSQCKGGACKLAGLCRSQGLKKSIGQCLACQFAALCECKGACNNPGNKNGGNKVARSDSPKNTWGTGSSGQPTTNESTRIDATLNREEITGTQGEGPSDKEVAHSPEGREQASREYREKYQQYRRTAEAVLDSEPLPLGHRQTIRKYFESIRPDNESPEATKPNPPADGEK